MKILALENTSFGTLQITGKLSFSKRLNIIIAPNQSGKSTMMTLIEWLLYGPPPLGSKRNISLIERWAPWDGSALRATAYIQPEIEGWPEQVRLDVDFPAYSVRLTDAKTLAELNDSITMNKNGTWDLGRQLLGLSRGAFRASLMAGQGQLEAMLDSQELKKILSADMNELVEDPELAGLDSAIRLLDKPSFVMVDVQETPVQMPYLTKRSEELFSMRSADRRTKEERYERIEQLMSERELAEIRLSTEHQKITRLQKQLQDYNLAVSHWRFQQVRKERDRLSEWGSRLKAAPYLENFPFDLEQIIERWQGERKQLIEQKHAAAIKVDQANSRVADHDDFINRHQDWQDQLNDLDELNKLSASIQASEKERQAAEEDVKEYGEVADPETRQRFDNLELELKPHAEYLAQTGEWVEANQELMAERAKLDEEKAALKELARVIPPWRYLAAYGLLGLAVVALAVGFSVEGTLVAGITAAVILLIFGLVLLAGSMSKKREADRASRELERKIKEQEGSLLTRETEHQAAMKLLIRQFGITDAEWVMLTNKVPVYQRLKFKLDRYSQAKNMRDSAIGWICENWKGIRDIAPDAPEDPDPLWLKRRLRALADLKQRTIDRMNIHASAKELEREIDRIETNIGELRDRVAKSFVPLGLDQQMKDQPDKAVQHYHGMALEARKYAEQVQRLAAAEQQAQSLPMTTGEYEESWKVLDPAEADRISGLISDESSYTRIRGDCRKLIDTITNLRKTLDKTLNEVTRLRVTTAKDEEVLTDLPEARVKEEEARQHVQVVRRWRGALDLLQNTFRELQAELAGALAPRMSEEIVLLLKQAPVAGVDDVKVGPNLDLRLIVDGAPPGLTGQELVDALSLGARRQLALAMRCAVARSLSDSHSAPLLLDEPLAELDDGRAADCLAFLDKLSDNHQVFMATCHNAQYEWLMRKSRVMPGVINL